MTGEIGVDFYIFFENTIDGIAFSPEGNPNRPGVRPGGHISFGQIKFQGNREKPLFQGVDRVKKKNKNGSHQA
jgi:hypothetical protein